MTTDHSPEHSSPANPDETAAPASTVDTGKPGLASLFSAAASALSEKNARPWQQKGNTAHHEKRIGMAPRGTRRSMGKR